MPIVNDTIFHTFDQDPMMNINTGAIALTGAVLFGGILSTYLWKSAMKDQVNFINSPSYYPYGRQNSVFKNQLYQIMI